MPESRLAPVTPPINFFGDLADLIIPVLPPQDGPTWHKITEHSKISELSPTDEAFLQGVTEKTPWKAPVIQVESVEDINNIQLRLDEMHNIAAIGARDEYRRMLRAIYDGKLGEFLQIDFSKDQPLGVMDAYENLLIAVSTTHKPQKQLKGGESFLLALQNLRDVQKRYSEDLTIDPLQTDAFKFLSTFNQDIIQSKHYLQRNEKGFSYVSEKPEGEETTFGKIPRYAELKQESQSNVLPEIQPAEPTKPAKGNVFGRIWRGFQLPLKDVETAVQRVENPLPEFNPSTPVDLQMLYQTVRTAMQDNVHALYVPRPELTREELTQEGEKLGALIDNLEIPEALLPTYERILAAHETFLPKFFGYNIVSEMPTNVRQAYGAFSKRLIFGYQDDAYGTIPDLLLGNALVAVDRENHRPSMLHRALTHVGKAEEIVHHWTKAVLEGRFQKFWKEVLQKNHYFTQIDTIVVHNEYPPIVPAAYVETKSQANITIPLSRVERVGKPSLDDIRFLSSNIANKTPEAVHRFRQSFRQFKNIDVRVYVPRYHAATDASSSASGVMSPEASFLWLANMIHALYKGNTIDEISVDTAPIWPKKDTTPEAVLRKLTSVVNVVDPNISQDVLSNFVICEPQEGGKLVVLVPENFAGELLKNPASGKSEYTKIARLQNIFPSWFAEFVVVDGTSKPVNKVLSTVVNAPHYRAWVEQYKKEFASVTGVDQDASTEKSPSIILRPAVVACAQTDEYRDVIAFDEHKRSIGIIGNAIHTRHGGKRQSSGENPLRIGVEVFGNARPMGGILEKPLVLEDGASSSGIFHYLNIADGRLRDRWRPYRRSKSPRAFGEDRPVHTTAILTGTQENQYVIAQRNSDAIVYVVHTNGSVTPLMRDIWVEDAALPIRAGFATVLEPKMSPTEADDLNELLQRCIDNTTGVGNILLDRAKALTPDAKEMLDALRLERDKRIASNTGDIFTPGDLRLVETYAPGHLKHLRWYVSKMIFAVSELPDRMTRVIQKVQPGDVVVVSNAHPSVVAAAGKKYFGNVERLTTAIRETQERVFIQDGRYVGKQIGAVAMRVV